MRTLILSDTQFGNHRQFATYKDGMNSRLLLQLAAVADAMRWGKKNGATRMIHLGDLFEENDYIEPDVANLLLDKLPFELYPTQVFVLTGNHDATDNHWLHSKIRVFMNCFYPVGFYLRPSNSNELFMPHLRDEQLFAAEMEKSWPKVQDYGKYVLYMHQTIIGATYGGRTFGKGVPLKFLKQFKAVFCGHIHQSQDFKGTNVHIVGAPYQITFGDTYTPRVLLVEDGKILKTYTPPHPRFLRTDKIPPKDGNFYMYTGSSPESLNNTEGVRVQPPIEKKSRVRVKATNDAALIRAYCKREGHPELEQLGLKLWDGK